MTKIMNKLFLEPIEAVLPIYDSRGTNASQIIYSSGEVQIIPTNVLKFIEKWFWRAFKVHIVGRRMWSREVVNRRNLNPLIAHEDIVMIPVKTRDAIGSKDGCYGYIRLNSITYFNETTIFLRSGARIPYFSAIETLKNKLQSARLLRYTYKEESLFQNRIIVSYQNPAPNPPSSKT